MRSSRTLAVMPLVRIVALIGLSAGSCASAAVDEEKLLLSHRACFNGWSEITDYDSLPDDKIASLIQEKCASTRFSAYAALGGIGPGKPGEPSPGEKVAARLDAAELQWVAHWREYLSKRKRARR